MLSPASLFQVPRLISVVVQSQVMRKTRGVGGGERERGCFIFATSLLSESLVQTNFQLVLEH